MASMQTNNRSKRSKRRLRNLLFTVQELLNLPDGSSEAETLTSATNHLLLSMSALPSGAADDRSTIEDDLASVLPETTSRVDVSKVQSPLSTQVVVAPRSVAHAPNSAQQEQKEDARKMDGYQREQQTSGSPWGASMVAPFPLPVIPPVQPPPTEQPTASPQLHSVLANPVVAALPVAMAVAHARRAETQLFIQDDRNMDGHQLEHQPSGFPQESSSAVAHHPLLVTHSVQHSPAEQHTLATDSMRPPQVHSVHDLQPNEEQLPFGLQLLADMATYGPASPCGKRM